MSQPVSNPPPDTQVVIEEREPRWREMRLYQCPGCWNYAVHPQMPALEGWVECGCGERMTLIDLRARTTDGPHGKNWHEDET